MRVYAKLFIIIATLSSCVSHNLPPNVGTVLFSPEDVDKEQWTKSELEALRARQYFQNVIPPPYLTNTFNDEYLLNLLGYFENCYNAIDKEADDYSEQEVMDMALSDAIGGYIKVWVLPITKYAYYGGSISSDNAIKVFQLYSNIKRELKTDGQSWRGANDDMLKSVSIDIASRPHEWFPRSAHDACDRLAYYEKSDKGLVIPLPYINWCLNPQTMFLPLKNQSLVQLMSPNSSSALVDYYTVAASCINSQNYDSHDDFSSRFQIWLTSIVVPHLKDDNLYIAFGSVLSLLNKTKSFYKDVANFWDDKYTYLQNRAVAAGCPISWTSKKVMIIFILIFIEVLWCIPALCCVWSQKKKKNKLFQFFKKKPKHRKNMPFTSNKDKNLFPGVKLFLKPKTRNLEVDVEFPSYGPKYVTVKSVKSSKVTNEQLTHVNEIPNRASIKNKVTKHIKQPGEPSQHTCECPPIRSILKPSKCSKSVPVLADLKSTKTMTLYQEHEIKNISYTHASISMSKSVCKCISLNNKDDKINTNENIDNRTEEKEKISIQDNKTSKKDVASSAIKNTAVEQSKEIMSRSYVKSRSRSLKIQDSNMKKISAVKREEKPSLHPVPTVKEDEPQTMIQRSKLIEATRSNKSKECTNNQSRNTPRVSQNIDPKITTKLEDASKVSKTKPTISSTKDDKLKESRRKSRVPKLFRSKKANKSDEKEKNPPDHPKLNIKIYNTRADVGKRSDITKTSKQSQEVKEGNDKEYHTLNIDIDNPQTDIEVDITTYRSKVRSSKIPRRIIFKGDNSLNSSNPSTTLIQDKQLPGTTKKDCKTVKTTLDDSALPKVPKKNDRLNSTL